MAGLSLVLAAVSGALSQDVHVVVRAPTEVAISCSLDDRAGKPQVPRLAATGPRAWTWSRRPGDVLRCSGAGLEPLDSDSSGAVIPSELTLEMAAARPVTVEAGWGGVEAVVEWRALEPGATVLLAQRRERVGDRLTLPVANRPRVLRLRVAGASPISLFVPEGDSPVVLRARRPTAGGEVFGLVPPHRYTPEALELSAGAKPRALPVDRWRVFQASGVPPGRHALVARYRGGVRAKPLTVVVPPGGTVEQLPLALPEPGAAQVSVASELCDGERLPVKLLLHPYLSDPTGAPIAVLEQTVRDPPCDREVEGLAEGEHQAVLSRAPTGVEVLSLARFKIVRGEKTEVFLQGPAVRLTGRLTRGEKRPAAGLVVLFELDTRTWSAETDEQGEYDVVLGPPGEYAVSVRASGDVTAASFSRRFEAGEQRADFRIDDGLLEVRVVRPAGSAREPVELSVLTPDGRRLGGSCASNEESTRFVGLKLGTYSVTGRTASGLTTERAASVELTEEEPAGEVELVLGPR
jgi:hypothetical protein